MVKRSLLGVGILICIFASASNSTYANNIDMSVDLAASSTLVLPSTPVNLAIEPTTDGRFSSGSFNVTAYSNSPAGYTLTMTTTSVNLTSDTYNAATETYPVIPTLSNDATASTFELNKWGISLDGGTTYVPMTTERTLVDTTSTGALANGEVTTIGIGAKLDLETVPGKYSTTINFALVALMPHYSLEDAYSARGREKATVDNEEYYTMQDMTPSICAIADQGSELQVVDTRDNKIYWILKARDDKCWMTQNLDHNIVTTSNFYTPDNTDIDSNWTATLGTIASSSVDPDGFITDWTSNSNTSATSFDPGDWYFTDTWYDSDNCLSNAENAYAGCNYLANLADNKFNTVPYSNNGTHGHIGNYYNWSAAAALNDSSSFTDDNSNPNRSICPKGWRLPISGSSDELEGLFESYSHVSGQGDQIIATSPLYFTRGGNIYRDAANGGAYIHSAGYQGFYWTGTVSSNADAYRLELNSASTSTDLPGRRHNGRLVRCVAR